MPGSGGRAALALCLGATLALTACGAHRQAALRSEQSSQVPKRAGFGPVAKPVAPLRCVPGVRRLGSTRTAYAAVARRALQVFARPGKRTVVRRLGLDDVNGYRTVFSVIAARTGSSCRAAGWYRVRLSTTPNGSTGWVRARDVALYRVSSRIVVDLGRRRLVAYRNGRKVLETPVAIGTPQTPTPVGQFYVNERWTLTDPDGPFGVAALGISAHSDVLRNWVQGGPIALHGTDEPSLIGQAASHGCVRLRNDAMQRLFALAPAGTPVTIRA
jgi:lipoprotein-anchoring transpeptidase ErfK/SrfK